ncbi:MAG: cell envelope integrity protein TolA [Gammaproteobacteria bacterium]|nr:cell envelope integrity protein TolA [Gammaproteobacteria bacterium]MBU1776676.1 cell envelope integrity protein TolA [Gammaproteobacteria bacterium]MBU1968272.1 cell envelope integrity protein TolA [Gammaproteobacteria bacterium]
MSATLSYQDPYRLPAGMLALAVHLFFFLLLYFGFRWQSHPPDAFMVEMWDSLPSTETVREQSLPPPPDRTEPVSPPKVTAPALPPAKAGIEIQDKKLKQKKQVEEKAKAAAAAKAKQEAERRELEAYSDKLRQAERVRQSEQKRIRAEVDAATATQVGRYQDMIRSKIRRNIVKQEVPPTAEATFSVTLLPDGSVMEVELLKGSGYAAYDNAAERAIYKAQPLPIPTDVELQKMFRVLKLTIRPE